MAEKTNNDEYVEASSGARAVVVMILGLGLVAIYLVSGLLENLLPAEDAGIEEIELTIAKLAKWIDYLLLFSLLLSTTLCIFFVRLGTQTGESGRYPPPGFSVIRRTRVLTGERTRKFVRLSYLFAIFAWLPVIATLYLKWLLMSFA